MRIVVRTEVAVLIDPVDQDLFEGCRWFVTQNGSKTYVQRKSGRRNEYLHRVIATRVHGPCDGKDVDHINGDPLDNRRSNLRAVSHRENLRNRAGPNANSSSGHLGVSPDRSRGGYRAYIKVEDRMIWLGRFEHIDEAVAARRRAEEKYWNFI